MSPRTNFLPRNEKSYADMLWEVVTDLPTDSIIAHNDPRLSFSLTAQPNAVAVVAKRLEREQQRTLANVRSEGYKIVAGVSHTHQARRHLKGAQRKARRAYLSASSIDTREMTGAQQVEAAELAQRAEFLARAANGSSKKLDHSKFLETENE